jgi:alanyl-tRNA synthetase
VVGESARQAGSLVSPEGLRFDFPFDRALTREEIAAIQDEVRRVVREDRTVTPSYMSMQEAIDAGADAFFDEKYGETVRTVRVDGYSHELCGGTHARATGQIGGFVITGERSIGSGMRRIAALTGAGADAWHDRRVAILEAAADASGAQSEDALPDRIRAVQDELKEAKRRLKSGGGAGLPKPGELAARAQEAAPGINLVSFAGPYESIDALKGAAKDVRGSFESGVIALGLEAEEPQVFVTVSDDLVARGIKAGDLVRDAVAAIEGKGTKADGLNDAMEAIRTALTKAG